MILHRVRISTVILCTGMTLIACGTAPGQSPAAQIVAAGKALFEHHWQAGQPGVPGGDGLGPVYNANSCATCHQQGGVGGAGGLEFNAEMLSVVPQSKDSPLKSNDFIYELRGIHPGLVSATDEIVPSVILHRFGVDPRYADARRKFLGEYGVPAGHGGQKEELQRLMANRPVISIAPSRVVHFHISQRNTPPLFGLGLIEAIPHATLLNLARAQNRKGSEVSGRIAPVGLEAGKYGWRGQISRLHEFVLGACANEIGLQVATKDQNINPFNPKYTAPGLDLTKEQAKTITAFVASLPPPRIVKPDDPERAAVAKRGYQVFASVGCAACHVENVAPAKGIYSDLLLHDLGPALLDPIPAVPTMRVDRVEVHTMKDGEKRLEPAFKPGTKLPLTYTGLGATTVLSNLNQEWRTPPLWGLADSGPYLHDGRAATVLEAIILHGGEAKLTTERFLALPTSDRLAVLEFLGCLRAP